MRGGLRIAKRRALQFTRRQALALGAGALLGACGQQPSAIVQRPQAPEYRFGRGKRPNIVVFLADTMRADALGCYNPAVTWTPNLDAFAQDTLLFERCYSQASWTKPSIGSLFTGVLPAVHQAVVSQVVASIDNDPQAQRLRGEFATLAEMLQAVGYRTAWFLANPMVHPGFGYRQGFGHVRYVQGEAPEPQISAIIDWMKRPMREPFFVFIHEKDPHGPYTPSPEQFRKTHNLALADEQRRVSSTDRELLDVYYDSYRRGGDGSDREEALQQLSPGGVAHFKQLYEAEVAEVDEQFGRLYQYLDSTGALDDTLVVFTSDHGEAFGEHGQFSHGQTLYNEEIHVPLLIRLPREPAPQQVPWTVGLYDLYPTLLTLAGATAPSYTQARTLLDLDGACTVTNHRHVFSELDYARPGIMGFDVAMIHGARKILITDKGQRKQAFDLDASPDERDDILAASRTMQELLAHLERERTEYLRLSDAFGRAEWGTYDPDVQEHLRGLGYL